MLAVQASDELEDDIGSSSIEIAGGLVRQKDLGPSDQSPSQGKPLLLTAGKFAGAMVSARLQPDFTQPLRRLLFG